MGFHLFFLETHQVGVIFFFCIDLSGSADHFLYPQNNCAYSLCVNLTPLIYAIYLTIHFMFSQRIFVFHYHIYRLFFNWHIFFHISVNLKPAVFKISQTHGQKPNKVNLNPRWIKDSFNHNYRTGSFENNDAQVIQSMCILPCSAHFVFNS